MRRTAWIALLAVLLHAFAPLLAGAAPADAPYHVELCTALGTVTVELDAGTTPAPSRASPDHCQACAFHCAAPTAARTEPAPQPAGMRPRAFAPQPACCSRTRTASRPRAPPSAA
jgi:hypothetical protein